MANQFDVIDYLLNNEKYMNNKSLPVLIKEGLRGCSEKKSYKTAIVLISIARQENIDLGYLISDEISSTSTGFLEFLLSFNFLDPSKPNENGDYPIILSTHFRNYDMVKLLLNDVRINPSVKNNEFIKNVDDKDFRIIELYLSDDRVSEVNLSSENLVLKNNLLKNKLLTIKRLDLQSNHDILMFMDIIEDNIYLARLKVFDLLIKHKKIQANNIAIIKNNIFRQYYVKDDKTLIKLLNNKNIPKFDYLTHSGVVLLLTYLKTEDNNILDVLLDMLPIYVQYDIKKWLDF